MVAYVLVHVSYVNGIRVQRNLLVEDNEPAILEVSEKVAESAW